jgi:hypothetical protein
MAKWASNGERILRLDSGVTVSADEIILRIYWLRKENAELRERAEKWERAFHTEYSQWLRLRDAAREARKHARALKNTPRHLRGMAYDDGLARRIDDVLTEALAASEEHGEEKDGG